MREAGTIAKTTSALALTVSLLAGASPVVAVLATALTLFAAECLAQRVRGRLSLRVGRTTETDLS